VSTPCRYSVFIGLLDQWINKYNVKHILLLKDIYEDNRLLYHEILFINILKIFF